MEQQQMQQQQQMLQMQAQQMAQQEEADRQQQLRYLWGRAATLLVTGPPSQEAAMELSSVLQSYHAVSGWEEFVQNIGGHQASMQQAYELLASTVVGSLSPLGRHWTAATRTHTCGT